jgi:ribonuclease P protein component
VLKDGQNSPSPTNANSGYPAGKADFPPENRLRGRDAIRHTAYQGVKIPGKWLGLAVAEGSPTRFGISVSRKFGKAVRRNRVKRIIREFLRNNKPLWPSNKWIIIRLRKDPGDDTEIIEDLKKAISKIR